MLTAAILLLAAFAPEPTAPERIGLDQARVLDGRLVATSFVTTPPYTFAGVTVYGAAASSGRRSCAGTDSTMWPRAGGSGWSGGCE
jgi:hypothetical protein